MSNHQYGHTHQILHTAIFHHNHNEGNNNTVRTNNKVTLEPLYPPQSPKVKVQQKQNRNKNKNKNKNKTRPGQQSKLCKFGIFYEQGDEKSFGLGILREGRMDWSCELQGNLFHVHNSPGGHIFHKRGK